MFAQGQAARERDGAGRGQGVVQHKVGGAALVPRQRVGRFAVHDDPIIRPIWPALHLEVNPGAVEAEVQQIAVRIWVGGLCSDAPAGAVAQRRVIRTVLARRQDRLGAGSVGHRIPGCPPIAIRRAQCETEPGVIRRARGAVSGPEQRAEPRLLPRGDAVGLPCIVSLLSRGHLAPRRHGRRLTVAGGIPAERRRPQRRLAVAVAQHHLAQQLRAGEIEGRRVRRGIGGRGEAIGLGRDDVEPLPCAELVEGIQVGNIAQVSAAGLRGGRERRQHDLRVGVGSPDLDRSLAQQAHVVRRVGRPAAPVRRDIRLVPHLVVADLLTVTISHGRGEGAEVAALVGRGLKICAVGFGPRPGRGAIQYDHRFQGGIAGQGCKNRIPARPVIFAPGRLDLGPRQHEAHPADTGTVKVSQRDG